MICKNCGNEAENEKICPSCGSEVKEKRIKKRIIIPIISAIVVIIMGICMLSVGNVSDKNRLKAALETNVWFTQISDSEFVVIKFKDEKFAITRITDSESEDDIENYEYAPVSDGAFKVGDDVYSVNFINEGMQISPGIADKNSKEEMWYQIEE